jgi:DNA-binding NarL/FixJ family response regulator
MCALILKTMTQKIKIIIAEDQELFRKSLAALLETYQELDIVTEASNGLELIKCLEQVHAHVVLLDIDIRVMNSRATLEIIKLRFPEIKVIILSARPDRHLKSYYMVYGANSYLNKSCDVQTLLKAIKTVKLEDYFF